MTTTNIDRQAENFLIRRMHMARVRQWIIAGASVLLTALSMLLLSPETIGNVAYYSLIALMLLNALVALQQSACVLFPIETLLKQIRRIEHDVDRGRLSTGHLTTHSRDIFAALTIGIDNLVTKLAERARAADEKLLLSAAMLQATPFTIFTVTKTGKVGTLVRDMYGIVSLLGIEENATPRPEIWREANLRIFQDAVAKSFTVDGFQWFDLDLPPHHLRACVKRINAFAALVEIGDLPAIDQSVAQVTGHTNVNSFTHQRDVLKRFASSIAHDAKNIFAAIGNLVELNKNSSDSKVVCLIPLAEDAIRRGTNLMRELTTFAGETRLKRVCVPAAQALGAIINAPALRALLPSNVQFFPTIAHTPMPEIDLDADQFWKVLLNLTQNGVEAINGCNGRIWINVEPYTLTAEALYIYHHANTLVPGPGVRIVFTDDGPGIDDKMREHLFDPFYSSKGTGRGIGLSTALAIINAHGGAIHVRSAPGGGTSFHIFLPASRNTAAEREMMQAIAPNGEILLVDDDPAILKTTGHILRTLKLAAHPANSEHDAWAKLNALNTRIKAVMVDAHIQGSTTALFVKALHTHYPNLPVIVTSGDTRAHVDELFEGTPYDVFLEKPYSLAELKNALTTIITQ